MLQWSWLAALLGGAVYLGLNVLIEVLFPDHWAGSPDRLLGWGYADFSRLLWIPSTLQLLGLTGIFVHLSGAVNRLAKIGFAIAAVGYSLEIVGNLIEFWIFGLLLVPYLGDFLTGSAGSQLGYTVSSFGTLFLMVGLLLLGIAYLRAALPRRWRFLPLVIGLIHAAILPSYFMGLLAAHAVAFGLGWMGLGYFLWRDKSRLMAEPALGAVRQPLAK